MASMEYVQISVSDSSMVGFQRYCYHHEQMDLSGLKSLTFIIKNIAFRLFDLICV